MAIRLPAVNSFTARVCFVPEFLIAWASSRIASRQRYCFIQSVRTSMP